jgi:hypothetical protein
METTVSHDDKYHCVLVFGKTLSLLVNYPSNTPRANQIAYTTANWDTSIVENLGKAWEKVRANRGSGEIDRQNLVLFEARLAWGQVTSRNLHCRGAQLPA